MNERIMVKNHMGYFDLLEKGPIVAKNKGLLKVPNDKTFDQMPVSHYVSLAKEIGWKKVSRGLVNLIVWNKKKNPSISAKARKIHDAVAKQMEKKEEAKSGVCPKCGSKAIPDGYGKCTNCGKKL